MTTALLHPVQHACETLGVGRTTLYDLAAKGEIEFVKIGRKTLVPADSIERYVERLKAEHKVGFVA